MGTGDRISNPSAKPPGTQATLHWPGYKSTGRRASDFVKCDDPHCAERGRNFGGGKPALATGPTHGLHIVCWPKDQ